MNTQRLLTTFVSVLMVMFPVFGQQVPLIDREVFFGNPKIAGGQISPDGQWVSFLKEYDGIMNIWVKKINEPFEQAKPLTNSKRPMYGYSWTLDGKYILYVKDKDGDENMNIYAVKPSDADGKNIPPSRNLTDKKEVTAQIYHASEKDADLLFIGLNDRDKAWHDLYSLKISTGELKLLYENKERITSYTFDWDDNLRILSKTDEKGTTTYYRLNPDKSLTEIYQVTVKEGAGFLAFTPDNQKVYLETNKGDLDKSALFLMDLKTLKMEKIHQDPQNKVDFGSIILDRNTRKIVGYAYTYDKTLYYWTDEKWKKYHEFLQGKFPGKEVAFQSFDKNYTKFLVSVSSDTYVAEVHYFEPATNKLVLQYVPRPELKKYEQHLASMQPITYKSSDGLEIPAYLTIPKGTNGKNLPVVVLVHGGPKGPRDYWGYNGTVQFLANRGYAVLQPNFRASGGYGKKFMNAGDKQWGKLMQDDVTWGVKHLVEKGIADPKRVAIMGGSYGGYATLAGLAFTPDLYTCGVDIVGPSNIFTLLESIPPYWEAGRAFLYEMVGDPNTEEGKKLIREASPLFSADKIVKPLLIIQGANDPRVKKAEADQIAIALRDKGKPVSYLLADDEGHGFAKPVNNMAMYAEIEKFLAEHLKGRYQQDMTDNVAKRLEELRVDVSKLTLAPKNNDKPAAQLPPLKPKFQSNQTENFASSISMQGQTLNINSKKTFQFQNNQWTLTEETNFMGQVSKDLFITDANLKPLKRTIQQSGTTIDVQFETNKVLVTMQGKTTEVPYEGALLDGNSFIGYYLAAMPLKDNFSIVINVFDVQKMAVKKAKIQVIGKEDLNGKTCWKVEITAIEDERKSYYWIGVEDGSWEKMTSKIPELNGAELISIKK